METPISIDSSKVVIEVVRTETIKPLTPTPDHLKKFGMTVFDHLACNAYMKWLFFYPATAGDTCAADRNRRLKESLSETLVRFYPVAGRVDLEGAYVDCDDSGAYFVETKVNGCCLADILKEPDNEVLRKLLPCDRYTSGPHPLMRVQSNSFDCGGTALAVCVHHLVMDGFGRSAFLKQWAAAARGDAERSPPPDLGAIASRFPAVPNLGFSKHTIPPDNNVMRRFVFDGVKITSLRDKLTSASGVRPTRVEAVTAFIYKCMVNALTVQLGHEAGPSLACLLVNLRTRYDPPLSETSLGNMASMIVAESGGQNEFVNDPPSIIAQFKKRMRELTSNCSTKLKDSVKILKATGERPEYWRDDVDVYVFSSICGFGLYGIDFGWGEPVWISLPDWKSHRATGMIEAREGGGIEAWIGLPEEHMTFFETNIDLLEFASLNPPISIS